MVSGQHNICSAFVLKTNSVVFVFVRNIGKCEYSVKDTNRVSIGVVLGLLDKLAEMASTDKVDDALT